MTFSLSPSKYWLLLGLIFIAFVLIRTYHLPQTLLFYGDLGRDFLVLQDWVSSYKPPLLGPQTSALPINQSAWYFYLLLPVYLISQSFYTHAITLILLTGLFILWFGRLAWLNAVLRQPLFIGLILLCFHPETIVQQRYIWNPSFIPIFVLGICAYYVIITTLAYNKLDVFLFTALIALATGFSYAVLPVVLMFFILAIFRLANRRLQLCFYQLINLILVFLPTAIFELRHSLLLTNRLLFGEKLTFSDPFINKLTRLPELLFGGRLSAVLIGFGILVLAGLFIIKKVKPNRLWQDVTLILVLSLVLTLVLPFPLNHHYIFALLTLTFFWLGLWPCRLAWGLTGLCLMFWLAPPQPGRYLKPAPRTLTETVACVTNFCQTHPGKYYVTTQSAYHPQHDAKEYEYLFNRFGCQASDITLPKFESDKMAVIVEDSQFTAGQTAYNELTLFGPAQAGSVFTCQPNLSIHILIRP